MREILFRAKTVNRPPKGTYRTDYENGDWVYGLISDINEYGALMTNTDGVGGIDVDKCTVGEYTGLLDKNGNKIFEGDIVKVYSLKGGYGNPEIKVVEYNTKSLCYEFYRWSGDIHYVEVIGNIYDNLDLLEDEQ